MTYNGPYDVEIRHNSTGEVRRFRLWFPWNDGSDFWWSDGNFGCDCNRSYVWLWAEGKSSVGVEATCGDGAYSVRCWTPDDKLLYADEDWSP